jgi:hypothetical protein
LKSVAGAKRSAFQNTHFLTNYGVGGKIFEEKLFNLFQILFQNMLSRLADETFKIQSDATENKWVKRAVTDNVFCLCYTCIAVAINKCEKVPQFGATCASPDISFPLASGKLMHQVSH